LIFKRFIQGGARARAQMLEEDPSAVVRPLALLAR